MRARRHFLRLPVVIPLVCAALTLAACGENLPATTLYPEGDHAQRIYDLLVPIFWAALGVFVVVEGLLVYAVCFNMSNPTPVPAPPPTVPVPPP